LSLNSANSKEFYGSFSSYQIMKSDGGLGVALCNFHADISAV